MSDDRWWGPVRTNSLKLLAVGVALIAGWAVLAAVTSVGDPGDIGGGLPLHPGYSCAGGGLLLVAKEVWTYWSTRR